MACAKNQSVTNDSSSISNQRQYTQNLTIYNNEYNQSSCRKIKSFYPNFAPTIESMSTTSSKIGVYTVVYINGSNFLPPAYGNTFINFSKTFKNIPIIFYSTTQISFVVPLNEYSGIYNVEVVNVYNSNFSPAINNTYAGNLNFSNSVAYTLI